MVFLEILVLKVSFMPDYKKKSSLLHLAQKCHTFESFQMASLMHDISVNSVAPRMYNVTSLRDHTLFSNYLSHLMINSQR